MHGTTSCSACGYDPCLCHRKPSDRPDATRKRKAESRRREQIDQWIDRWIDHYNEAAGLDACRSLLELEPHFGGALFRKSRERARLKGLSRDYLSICLKRFPAGSRSATPGGRGTTCTARYGAPANAWRRMRSAHLVGADRCSGSRFR
jgi:hypothetical protein